MPPSCFLVLDIILISAAPAMQNILDVRMIGRCGNEERERGGNGMRVDGWRRESRAGQRSDAQQFSKRLIFLELCAPSYRLGY